MKVLAIDTATEQCSVALLSADGRWTRETPTARNHADLILPMIEQLFAASGWSLTELDGLAFGRGPGSFTGVRIATGVAQGLALATGLPVVGISNLAAVAQQIVDDRHLAVGDEVLVCMDARMHEVYWAVYRVGDNGEVCSSGMERVSPAAEVVADAAHIKWGVGTGWRAYPELRKKFPLLDLDEARLPRAIEIAQLGMSALRAGEGTAAVGAQPVYLRDNVVRLASK
ncbi:MAG: tRNA (adenosine(37)-N6)-threonylcarbamoyltransferase complex dimerization subunit type 1 TsaB [Candidatus Obscuribacterales bacterium]|nr:tRNA (adenosine(37)-N6)-threonylcarbamoyltransferase complex dimerization subunit type 1 TsaB [Steroidobacteraceae bacterium]